MKPKALEIPLNKLPMDLMNRPTPVTIPPIASPIGAITASIPEITPKTT